MVRASGAPHAATLKAVIDTGKVFMDVVDGAVELVGLCLGWSAARMFTTAAATSPKENQ